jgi:hypothetical protein
MLVAFARGVSARAVMAAMTVRVASEDNDLFR